MDVNYEVSENDRKVIDAIVERAKKTWPAVDATSLAMDLTATHNHVRSEKLNMKHSFEPRFAAQEDKE